MSSYNTTYLTQGKSLKILSKEPWSVWNVYTPMTMYSTKPLAAVAKPGDAVQCRAAARDGLR